MSIAITMLVFAAIAFAVLEGLNREAYGEPIVPDQISRLFNHLDPGLPSGLNYDMSVLDPATQAQLNVLPQLGNVELRLALTNDTALPMTINFPTSLQCEFVVRRLYTFLGGFVVPLEVWRSSYFHNYPRQSSSLVLKPGQTKVYVAYWSINGLNQLQVPKGEYRVYTSFPGVKTLFIPKPL